MMVKTDKNGRVRNKKGMSRIPTGEDEVKKP